jgi:hypothetical protein
VVESDRFWKIDQLPDKLGLANFGKGLRAQNPDLRGLEDFDLETDVSPLIDPTGNGDDTVEKQAEAFIGMKASIDTWTEQNPPAPSVPLTTMTSSNPLFADYTFHNSNVFSIRDNYMYPGKDSQGNDIPVYLTEAFSDYIVIGWHSNPKDDPLTANTDPPGGEFQKTLEERLPELYMTLGWSTDTAKAQKDSKSSARILCHSSIYDVHFRRGGSPTTVKADEAGKNFHSDVFMEPLSVGTTPLYAPLMEYFSGLTTIRDALLTYLDAHADDPSGNLTDLSNGIRKLAGLLIAQDDGYDSQVKAQDLLYGHNYAEAFGGAVWHYDGRAETGHGPPTPCAAEVTTLHQLNSAQAILDATSRELELMRWTLFATWWNLVQDPLTNLVTPQAVKDHDALAKLVTGMFENIVLFEARQKAKQDFITATTNLDSNGKEIIIPGKPTPPRQPYKRTTKPPFYIRKDPTVCISGMASGWPANFSDPLLCRLEAQLVAGPRTLDSNVPKDLGAVRSLAQGLLAEFLIRPDPNSKDLAQIQRSGWKMWNDTQPFFPSVTSPPQHPDSAGANIR